MSIPRVMIAATKSGSGKTLITCALLQALLNRKLKVSAFKCGPDYIDPMFHTKVLSVPSGNLDLYFTEEKQTIDLFLENNDSDISVIEGVMGLYDGLGGISDRASAYHLAKTLKTPVILLVDAHGMGRSLLALIAGFLSMDKEHLIKGIILNRISESFYQSIAPVIEAELQIEVLGYFPVKKDLQLDSRYLGLKLPSEVADLKHKAQLGAETLEAGVKIDRILEIAKQADRLEKQETFEMVGGESVRIGVAYDEAFCFYYRENFDLLKKLGAELVFFSPLHDIKLPDNIQGIILGGGYPELVAKELSANTQMLTDIKEAIEKGMPSLAECGGFMYLHDIITDKDGKTYPMAGVIPGICEDKGKLVRFGYAEFTCNKQELSVRGHEFHYYDSTNCGTDSLAVKPLTGRNWECMHAGENHLWGFGHLYYPSEPAFVKWFLDACRAYKGKEA